jgi:glutamate carboxypeptidase
MTDNVVDFLESRLMNYLADLTTLVSLDSYSYEKDDVNRIVTWLEARLQSMRFTVQRYPQPTCGDNLLADRIGSGSSRILLLGHSDTVFPRGTAAQRPITYVGDKIIGPGTCDMKAGLLTGLYAVEALDAAGFTDYERLSFLIVSDEEIDERSSIPLIQSVSREFDTVLTLEAARENGDIVTARKGVRSFTAEAFGHAAHSGVEPEKGRNAILAIARQVDALEQLNDRARGITLNVGVIEGGRLRNVVPDHASIRFEVRAFNQSELDDMTERVVALFANETVPGVRFTVTYEQTSPPMPRTEAIAALEGMAATIAAELGFIAKGASTGGAGDAAFAAHEGRPVLDGMGPVGGLDHGPDEYILKSSIVPRTALLARLIMAVTNESRLTTKSQS